MARQDFINGGFIGKIGAIVGQRYHNKRYIRVFTPSSNPRTPEQTRRREEFAHAIRLAQEAMNINGHNGEWDTTAHSEFNARTSTALRRIRAGLPDDEALPLHPDSVIGPLNLDALTYDISPIPSDEAQEIIFYLYFSGGDQQYHIYNLKIEIIQLGSVVVSWEQEVEWAGGAPEEFEPGEPFPLALTDDTRTIHVTLTPEGETTPIIDKTYTDDNYAGKPAGFPSIGLSQSGLVFTATGSFYRANASDRFTLEICNYWPGYGEWYNQRRGETAASIAQGTGVLTQLFFEAAATQNRPDTNGRVFMPNRAEWMSDAVTDWAIPNNPRESFPTLYNIGRTVFYAHP